MQTLHYETTNMKQPTSNVIDFTAYCRNKQGDHAQKKVQEKTEPVHHQPTSAYKGLALDYCATGAIITMTVLVVAKFIGA